MPEIITCPDCGRKLRVPDALAGKQVKCPGCNIKFIGGVTTAPNKSPSKTASATSQRGKVEDDETDRRVVATPGGKRPERQTTDEGEDRPSRRRAVPVNEEEEDEDYPTRRSEYDEDARTGRKRRNFHGCGKVLLGLNLVVYAIYVGLGALALALVGGLLAFAIMGASFASTNPRTMAGGAVGSMVGVMILFIIIGALYLVQLVLQITGQGFCMAVPDKPGTGRRPLAIATFSCAIAWVVLYLGSCGMSGLAGGLGNNGGAASAMGGLINLLDYAVALAWFICFLLFLRSVAVSMRENALALQIVYYMIAVPIYTALMVTMIFVMAFAGALAIAGAASAKNGQGAATSMGAFGVFAIGCGILFLCVGIGLFIWYVVLVHQVRNSVRRYLD